MHNHDSNYVLVANIVFTPTNIRRYKKLSFHSNVVRNRDRHFIHALSSFILFVHFRFDLNVRPTAVVLFFIRMTDSLQDFRSENPGASTATVPNGVDSHDGQNLLEPTRFCRLILTISRADTQIWDLIWTGSDRIAQIGKFSEI